MRWKVEIGYKHTATDAMGDGIKKDIEDLGIKGVNYVKTRKLYMIEGELSEADIKNICEDLLVDNVTQFYEYGGSEYHSKDSDTWIVEVVYKPGVTDTVGDSTVKGIRDMGIEGINSVKTGQKYIINGSVSEDDIEIICKRLLANDVIQNYVYKKI